MANKSSISTNISIIINITNMAKKKEKKSIVSVKLPTEMRDELRMSCALKAHSHIKCCKDKTELQEQNFR